ncbi:FxSxx-COOH system tetratricopeptide repeat protein [Amycolatopsis sp. WAC 01375]|uniref:FxSxx-COOH system tetratricopeptide repeat protein n=1 Tax=Amycolatopsis sp. WAC 01375 TaxID=2203194 RepID=UPI0013157038|nr:FxSxx-COOH system tetratricopeptide repeat protein [Amycolatopsis sp. WAC 01375]
MWDSSPKDFRERHLVKPLWDALPLADGGIVQFQAIARDDLHACTTLEEMITRGVPLREIIRSAVSVVTGILTRWNKGQEGLDFKRVRIASHLREELGGRLASDGRITKWAVRAGLLDQDGSVVLHEDDDRLNPMALVLDAVPKATWSAVVHCGFGHRDLHPGNALIATDRGDFVLVDLSRSGENEPLAADPVNLLLTVLVRYLPDVESPLVRANLADLVVRRTPHSNVPRTLRDLVLKIYGAAQARLGADGMRAEWNTEYHLALVAAALRRASRAPDVETQQWFGDVAARAAKEITRSKVVVEFSADARTADATTADVARSAAVRSGPRSEVPGDGRPSSSLRSVPPLPRHAVERGSVPFEFRELTPSEQGWVVALYGPPGTGKTHLAATYVQRTAGAYSGVLWLAADGTNPLGSQVADYADGLSLPEAANGDLLRQELFAYLSANGPWLVVLDGATDVATIEEYLPRAPHVDVLITSRHAGWSEIAALCPVGAFTEEEATELCTMILGEQPGLLELASTLDLLPGAVVPAAHYLSTSTITPAQLRQLLVDRAATTLAEIPKSCGAVWSVILDAMGREDRRVLHLLEFAAFLGQGPVPVALLAAAPETTCPDLARLGADRLELEKVIRQGVAVGLLGPGPGTIELQPLFRLFLRERAAGRELTDAVRSALVQCASGLDAGDPRARPELQELLPHLLAVRLYEGDPDSQSLLLTTIRYLVVQRDLDSAMREARTAVQRWTERLGPYAKATLTAMGHLSHAHFQNGDEEQALALDREVAEAARRSHGPDSLVTLAAERDAAATALALQRSSGDAFRDLLARFEQRFGPDDPATLVVAHNRARELRGSLRLEEAFELENSVRFRMEAVLGEGHADTLRAGHLLARCLRDLGRHPEAREVNERVHRLRLQSLGELHPDTAQSAVSLAEDLRRAGELEGARTLLDVARPVLVDALGVDHPLTLLAAHELCTVLSRLGEPASDLAADTLARRVRVLGEDALDTIRTRKVLVDLLAADGEAVRSEVERRAVAVALSRITRR